MASKNQRIWSWALRGAREASQEAGAFEPRKFDTPAIEAAWRLLELAYRLNGITLNRVGVSLEDDLYIDFERTFTPRPKKYRKRWK